MFNRSPCLETCKRADWCLRKVWGRAGAKSSLCWPTAGKSDIHTDAGCRCYPTLLLDSRWACLKLLRLSVCVFVLLISVVFSLQPLLQLIFQFFSHTNVLQEESVKLDPWMAIGSFYDGWLAAEGGQLVHIFHVCDALISVLIRLCAHKKCICTIRQHRSLPAW